MSFLRVESMKTVMAVLLAGLALSPNAFAENGPEIRLKTGEMPLMAFLENVSEVLGARINASALTDKEHPRIRVSFGGPMSHEDALAQVHTVLALQGYSLVQDEESFHLLRMRDARDFNIPLITEENALPDTDMMVTHAIKLKHIPADDVARSLRSFGPANSRFVPDHASGILLITDAARAMKKYHKIIAYLDTPQAAQEIREFQKRPKPECRDLEPAGRHQTTFIVLFCLIGLVMGFLARGYLIRRIEGGL